MSNLAMFVVLLTGCLVASFAAPGEAAAAAAVHRALGVEGEIAVVVPPELDDDDEDDDGMDVVDLDEVLSKREDATPWATQRFKLKKCKGGKCRRKCNAKGKNGACVAFVCVCWK